MRTQILRLNSIPNVAKNLIYEIGHQFLSKITIIDVSNNVQLNDYGRITFLNLGQENFPDFLGHATITCDVTVNNNQIFMQTHSKLEIDINFQFSKDDKIKIEIYNSSGEREGYYTFIFS